MWTSLNCKMWKGKEETLDSSLDNFNIGGNRKLNPPVIHVWITRSKLSYNSNLNGENTIPIFTESSNTILSLQSLKNNEERDAERNPSYKTNRVVILGEERKDAQLFSY